MTSLKTVRIECMECGVLVIATLLDRAIAAWNRVPDVPAAPELNSEQAAFIMQRARAYADAFMESLDHEPTKNEADHILYLAIMRASTNFRKATNNG
jgi:hypothetical protein